MRHPWELFNVFAWDGASGANASANNGNSSSAGAADAAGYGEGVSAGIASQAPGYGVSFGTNAAANNSAVSVSYGGQGGSNGVGGGTGGGGGTASGGSGTGGYGIGTVNALNVALANQMFGKGVQGMNPAVVNALRAASLMGVPPGYATGVATAQSPVTVSGLGPAAPATPTLTQTQQNFLTAYQNAMLRGMATVGQGNPNAAPTTMGYPAIEGVSPGLSAAPAGPSQAHALAYGGAGVGNPNAPSPYASNVSMMTGGYGTGFGVPGQAAAAPTQSPFTAAMHQNIASNMGPSTGGGQANGGWGGRTSSDFSGQLQGGQHL